MESEKKRIENLSIWKHRVRFFPSSLTTWIPLYRVAYILSLGSSRAPQAAPRGTWLAVAFCRNTDTSSLEQTISHGSLLLRVFSSSKRRGKEERRDLSRSSRKNDLLLAGNETSGYLSSSECSAFTLLSPFSFPFSFSSPLFPFSPPLFLFLSVNFSSEKRGKRGREIKFGLSGEETVRMEFIDDTRAEFYSATRKSGSRAECERRRASLVSFRGLEM